MKVSLVSWFSVQPCGGTKWETHKKGETIPFGSIFM